ncbi:hypothetical protein D3C72_2155120 [compost metagenome]
MKFKTKAIAAISVFAVGFVAGLMVPRWLMFSFGLWTLVLLVAVAATAIFVGRKKGEKAENE